MDSTIAKLNAINKLRDELEELSSPSTGFHRIGESEFQKWDLFHRNSALIIKRLFGENNQYLHDWLKIEIPEDPDIEDDKGFSSYLHKQRIAEDKMENQLNIMAKEIVASKTDENNKPKKQKSNNKGVFIVHGKHYGPVKELKAILQEVKIKPIILHEQPSKGMTIIEKLEEYSNVLFAFIILTPDDSAIGKYEWLSCLRRYFKTIDASSDEIEEKLKHLDFNQMDILSQQYNAFHKDRARQNVILEFGYFIGRLGRRKVCCLYQGDLELPSDMHGICYLPFNNSVNEVKAIILEELKAAEIITRD